MKNLEQKLQEKVKNIELLLVHVEKVRVKVIWSSNCYLRMSSRGSVDKEDSELQAEMCWLHLHVEKNEDRDYD